MSKPKTVRTIVIVFVLSIAIITSLYFIWLNLPLTIKRHSDIVLGERIISKIEAYKTRHGLPATNDWDTFRELGFEDHTDYLTPQYQRINAATYELVFVEGFDGPYLLWNSKDKIWKEGMPSLSSDHTIR